MIQVSRGRSASRSCYKSQEGLEKDGANRSVSPNLLRQGSKSQHHEYVTAPAIPESDSYVQRKEGSQQLSVGKFS